ncbi:MAG: dephospho-CoA kinase [Vicinamibacterales bacterium]
MQKQPHRVALTGGIATGKSYIAKRLREAGVEVMDADLLAHDVVRPGSEALELVRRRFGDGMITAGGEMDRRRVAALVFADAGARRDLEAIIHPVVRQGIEQFFRTLPIRTPFAVADIPLLFETGRAGDFEVVVVAACAREIQMARVLAREGVTREDAERRLQAQWPIEDKVARADYVIRTDGTYEETDRAVEALIGSLGRRFPTESEARSS